MFVSCVVVSYEFVLVSRMFTVSFVIFALGFVGFVFLLLELLVLCLFTVSFVYIMLIIRPLYWFETVRTPLNRVGPLFGFVRFAFVYC